MIKTSIDIIVLPQLQEKSPVSGNPNQLGLLVVKTEKGTLIDVIILERKTKKLSNTTQVCLQRADRNFEIL
jgi:hypothetical protein